MHTRMKAIVVGAGYGGLTAAILLARKGYSVTVVEKNDQAGGRARMIKEKGYSFDMGPSWYMCPDVFEKFFSQIGRKVEDYLELVRLDPAYKVYFQNEGEVSVPGNKKDVLKLFDTLENNGGKKLERYLVDSKKKYDVSMDQFLYKEYKYIWDFFNPKLMLEGIGGLRNYHKHVARYFSSDRAQKLLEFMVVFLGSSPYNTPSIYSLLTHADINLGIWYPKGGLNALAKAMEKIAKEVGVTFAYNQPVSSYKIVNGEIKGVKAKQEFDADLVIVNADYAHAESLLPKKYQSYSPSYWKKRVMAPSCFLMYVGCDNIPQLEHHNLFLQKDWQSHFADVYDNPKWPDDPSFYVCAPSKTDKVAPKNKENLFFLVPIASGLPDTPAIRKKYEKKVFDLFEEFTGVRIKPNLIKLYGPKDFTKDYNAYKGNALGLAHTLMQTAVFRPSHHSKKVKGLHYTGQFTHPGIGVPMTVISSQVLVGGLK